MVKDKYERTDESAKAYVYSLQKAHDWHHPSLGKEKFKIASNIVDAALIKERQALDKDSMRTKGFCPRTGLKTNVLSPESYDKFIDTAIKRTNWTDPLLLLTLGTSMFLRPNSLARARLMHLRVDDCHGPIVSHFPKDKVQRRMEIVSIIEPPPRDNRRKKDSNILWGISSR